MAYVMTIEQHLDVAAMMDVLLDQTDRSLSHVFHCPHVGTIRARLQTIREFHKALANEDEGMQEHIEIMDGSACRKE